MKKLWKENRVLFILFVILIICLIAIVCVCLTFFYSKDTSVYGSRLDDIDKYPINDTFKKEYVSSLKDEEDISNATFKVQGRIIYVHVDFIDDVELDDAKKIIEDSLDSFSDDIKSYYDIEFMIKNNNFNIIGAKNSVSKNVSWNNNRIVEEEETNETD